MLLLQLTPLHLKLKHSFCPYVSTNSVQTSGHNTSNGRLLCSSMTSNGRPMPTKEKNNAKYDFQNLKSIVLSDKVLVFYRVSVFPAAHYQFLFDQLHDQGLDLNIA